VSEKVVGNFFGLAQGGDGAVQITGIPQDDRGDEEVPDQLLAHLSPLGWEHVNLTGDYIWSAERPVTENRDGFPLKDPARYRSQDPEFVVCPLMLQKLAVR
jgi:hypothetical protein